MKKTVITLTANEEYILQDIVQEMMCHEYINDGSIDVKVATTDLKEEERKTLSNEKYAVRLADRYREIECGGLCKKCNFIKYREKCEEYFAMNELLKEMRFREVE